MNQTKYTTTKYIVEAEASETYDPVIYDVYDTADEAIARFREVCKAIVNHEIDALGVDVYEKFPSNTHIYVIGSFIWSY